MFNKILSTNPYKKNLREKIDGVDDGYDFLVEVVDVHDSLKSIYDHSLLVEGQKLKNLYNVKHNDLVKIIYLQLKQSITTERLRLKVIQRNLQKNVKISVS